MLVGVVTYLSSNIAYNYRPRLVLPHTAPLASAPFGNGPISHTQAREYPSLRLVGIRVYRPVNSIRARGGGPLGTPAHQQYTPMATTCEL